jgi:transposase
VKDCAGALAMFDQHKDNLSTVANVLVDGGYAGTPFTKAVKDLLGATVQVAKRSKLYSFPVIPQRRVVERSFAWLEKCRCL